MTEDEKYEKEKEAYQELFNYLEKEHGVLALESQMQEIVSICKEIIKYE